MNAYNAWRDAIEDIKREGVNIIDSSGMSVFEKNNFIISFDPSSAKEPYRYLLSLDKWIFPSVNEIKSTLFSKEASIFYDYNLGNRIFKYAGKIDQICDYVIPLIEKSPYSRRIYVGVYNPSIDSKLDGRDVPGLVGINFRLRNNALEATAVLRSTDIFLGWPANALQLSFIQEYICKKCNLLKGSLSTISLNAHLFEENIEDLNFM